MGMRKIGGGSYGIYKKQKEFPWFAVIMIGLVILGVLFGR